ncbi:ThuA domain-containing protein [Flagellimonas algicola]|uniref:ThuA domain-containing protein n=1 Tax=Flagellimonas algicola TaxID=2583815 RepID=A0ABY2WRD3_9FLAO|nr:ThuA domain-containing protein [Allomuricauda algicola]TMU57503.1 ThuA domain-containing protein [Allomuricauda algicola]
MKKTLILFALLLVAQIKAQEAEPFVITEDWLSKIQSLAPDPSGTNDSEVKNLLIFSLHTGFEHWTIPHIEAVVQIIAEKSGGFKVTTSKDISVFEKSNLKKYDAVILNNNCSIGPKRDLFWDALEKDNSLSEKARNKKAKQLETNLLNYVKKGHGLMVVHGGIVMQNNSNAFSEMVGGSFDYHPKQQAIQINLVDAEHPMVKCFDPSGFAHIDEPYFFKNAYFDYNFRPLLYLEADKLDGLKNEVPDTIKYVSWIKKYGKGKVFYSSPSHNAQSLENPALLQFYLNGLQYITGSLECDDSPIERNHVGSKTAKSSR